MSDRKDDRHAPDDLDPDAPATAEEVAASQRLRDALEKARVPPLAPEDLLAPEKPLAPEIELAMALKAAWEPEALEADENRAVFDATPSAEEQAMAALLRDALARQDEPRAGDPGDVFLARALLAAFAPSALGDAEHRAIVDAALAKMPERALLATSSEQAPAPRRPNVIRIAFGVVTGGLALAASIVLVVTSAPHPGSEAPLALARTTQPLFSEPFKPGETSARIDRIASARAADFRDNRFAKWGVR